MLQSQDMQEEHSRSEISREDDDNIVQRPRNKRFRHSPKQIQKLEAYFQKNQHPDENQREEISKETGLQPCKVRYWFQNRRTQLKTQQQRIEKSFLLAEQEKLKASIMRMREALTKITCPRCGGESFDAQQLRTENARLKVEVTNAKLTVTRAWREGVKPDL